jgi:hypothetical protein
MIEEDQVVTVEQRFARAEAQGGPSPIWEKIQRRKATAFRLQKRLESSLGGVFG